ncbi:4-oxalocrotonate tautomerase (plasmid) [Pantoea agglomerans]|uniref:tautomerase family protein n=1 Tax=Enterobacter agglomerans TaxID=549 RepID=UPI0013984A6E|nr:tautomerase family protein [Pantoea agglomerans]QIA54805.1 4-oxalocrotonate tautomerase [Pantoea agglomerans]
MPGITLTLSGCNDQKSTKDCVLLATQITCEILKKNSFETMVIVRHVDDDDWFIDGKSLAKWGRNSFRLEVTVVDETCSKDQKAAYQKAIYKAMEQAIGNLHPQSNVHVIDCKAASYGYTGITQEYRYQHKDEFY